MSREQWIRKINETLQKQNRKLVKCRANDPRWFRIGDYFLIDTKTKIIVRNRIKLSAFAPSLTVAPSHTANSYARR